MTITTILTIPANITTNISIPAVLKIMAITNNDDNAITTISTMTITPMMAE